MHNPFGVFMCVSNTNFLLHSVQKFPAYITIVAFLLIVFVIDCVFVSVLCYLSYLKVWHNWPNACQNLDKAYIKEISILCFCIQNTHKWMHEWKQSTIIQISVSVIFECVHDFLKLFHIQYMFGCCIDKWRFLCLQTNTTYIHK